MGRALLIAFLQITKRSIELKIALEKILEDALALQSFREYEKSSFGMKHLIKGIPFSQKVRYGVSQKKVYAFGRLWNDTYMPISKNEILAVSERLTSM